MSAKQFSLRLIGKGASGIVRAALFVADRVAVLVMWAEGKNER
jgi:hypothetical protein